MLARIILLSYLWHSCLPLLERMIKVGSGIAFALLPLLMSACPARLEETAHFHQSSLEPPNGSYFGVHLDWEHDSAVAFSQRLGTSAAVYGAFFKFPFDDEERINLDNFITQVAQQRAIALIALEPRDELDTVTPLAASDLAQLLAKYNESGIPVFVRFAHEMNGSWYPWSQQPTGYVRAFRVLAEAIHRHAPLTAMLWAPNYGGGYPFDDGRYEVLPGSSDFQLLDTNQDGRLNMLDDMYLPYYPGDDVVDWVGMSVFHWGNQHPWGQNEIPEDGSFITRITGTYVGLAGDERAVPDFYQIYVEQHRKPMAVAETAALYNPAVGGNSERLIKQTWWRQVFSQRVATDFPGIKMINWFELRKFESEVGGIIDWSVTFNSELARAFLNDLPYQWLILCIVPSGERYGKK